MAQPFPAMDDDTIRESAHDIMGQPEFRQEETAYMLQKWLAKLEEWIKAFQDWSAENPFYTWLIIIGLLIVLILLITHIAYTAFGDGLGSKKSATGPAFGGRSMEVLEGKAASWREGLQKARSALASGHLHEAIWIGHRVLLGLLDELGCIQFQGYKTNTAYLRELGQQHAWFDLLKRFTSTYETAVYGSGQCEAGDVQSLIGEVTDCMRDTA